MNFRTTGNNVVVKLVKQEKTEGGIFIPETAQKEELFMEVVMVGEDCSRTKVGDMIMISPFSRPVRFELDNAEYMVVSDFDAMIIKK
jgi:chaperonin GroES